jgi:hypothetical protein
MRHYARPVIAFAPLGLPWRFDMSVEQKARTAHDDYRKIRAGRRELRVERTPFDERHDVVDRHQVESRA